MNSLLFIEDDDHIRLALRLVLEDEGYRVREAADGRSGLAAFHAEEPDLVLLDLRLPDISGFDVCRALRAMSIVPIIMVTAQTDTQDMVTGLEAGADDIVNHGDHFEVLCPIPAYDTVSKALQEKGLKPESSELAYVASIPVPVADAALAKQVLELIDALEALDDVKAVHGNHEIDDKLLDA